jgi:hypothetical protein
MTEPKPQITEAGGPEHYPVLPLRDIVVFPYMIVFFGTFSGPDLQFMPRLEDAFSLYTTMLLGMIVVFQMPTLVFFLAKMRLVTARFLWRHLKYAVLIIFILAAALTPDGSPWNQAVVAAPMLGLYLLSIGLAWLVAPPAQKASSAGADSTQLRLVFAATVLDQARRQRRIRVGDASRGRPRIRALDG